MFAGLQQNRRPEGLLIRLRHGQLLAELRLPFAAMPEAGTRLDP